MRRRRFLLFDRVRSVLSDWAARPRSLTGEQTDTDDSDKYIYLILPGLALFRLCLTIVMITGYSDQGCTQNALNDATAVSNLETYTRNERQPDLLLNGREPDRKAGEQEVTLSREGQTQDLYRLAQFIGYKNVAPVFQVAHRPPDEFRFPVILSAF